MAKLQMNAEELNRLLTSLGACQEAVNWAMDKSLAQAWKQCERADWMLWLCGKMVGKDNWPTRQQVVLAACTCARTALRYVPKGEKRPLIAIKTAERWARGEATRNEVRNAAATTSAAGYAAAAAYAAASATAAYAAAAYRKQAWNKSIKVLTEIVRKKLRIAL